MITKRAFLLFEQKSEAGIIKTSSNNKMLSSNSRNSKLAEYYILNTTGSKTINGGEYSY